jgi:hypothetical protein
MFCSKEKLIHKYYSWKALNLLQCFFLILNLFKILQVFVHRTCYCSIIEYTIEQKGKLEVYLWPLLETIANGRD